MITSTNRPILLCDNVNIKLIQQKIGYNILKINQICNMLFFIIDKHNFIRLGLRGFWRGAFLARHIHVRRKLVSVIPSLVCSVLALDGPT